MVKGPLRTVLWVLGAIGVLWVLFWLLALPSMGDMMQGGGMMAGGMGGGLGMMSMMGAMTLQFLGMLGLAGIFVYLVVDTLGGDGAERERAAASEETGR